MQFVWKSSPCIHSCKRSIAAMLNKYIDGPSSRVASPLGHQLIDLNPSCCRKRILRAMTNGDLTPGDNIVDEAADVERRLANIRELIMIAEAKEATRDTVGSKESQLTQEDKVVVANDVGVVGNGLNEVFV